MSHPFPGKARAVFLIVMMFTVLPIDTSSLTRPAYGLEDSSAALTEWVIPTAGSLPTGLALDPFGKCCWFVESSGNKIAHLDPSTDTFHEWAIPTPDSNPSSLALTTISESVAAFGTEYAKSKVFLFFPSTGMFKEYTLPEDSGPRYISIESGDTQIRAWFTKLEGNSIGEITYNPSSGTARLNELTLPAAAGGGAEDVYAGSGVIWFAGVSAIVKWDRAASRFTTWTIPPHPSTQAAFVDTDGSGQVWYTSTSSGTSSTDNYVGVLRSNNTFTEWQVPTAGAEARVISINPVTQNPWIAEHGGDKIAKLDPSSGGIVTSSRPTTTQFDPIAGALFTHVAGPVLPSTATSAPSVSTVTMSSTGQFAEWTVAAGTHPNDIVVDASGNVWILESSANKVARLSLKSDYVIECDPSSLIVMQSGNGTSTCTVTSIDGFASPVELVGSWPEAQPIGVAYTLQTPVTPTPGRGASSTLIISATPTASNGTFAFQVSGTSGSLTHTVNLEVTIAAGAADFAIVASPSYLSVPPSASAASNIIVESLGVFFSPVSLTSSGAPEGMALVFGANPVTPLIGETASSVLTVSVSGAPEGKHTITITGTAGSLTHSTTLTVQATRGPCLIATATYGSELSPEVQFLRGFRDNSVLKTNAGSNFMIVFNAWYYSFSPSVAEFIREQPTVRGIVKLALYPLIGILRIGAAAFSLFPTNLEAGAVLSGLLVSSLIGLVYLAIPLTALLACSSRARLIAKRLQLLALTILFGALAAVASTTAIGAPAAVMMAATSTMVIASLTVSAVFGSRLMLRMARLL